MIATATWLLPRAILAFVLMPGMVAYVVPVLFVAGDATRAPIGTPGVIVLAAGSALLLWCVYAFYSAGRGTLAPWSPPTRLVTTGPYRFSRNPMYIAVLMVVAGWALGFHSRAVGIYGAVLAVAFHLRIVLAEEPWLADTHGNAWVDYRARVARWIGTRRTIL